MFWSAQVSWSWTWGAYSAAPSVTGSSSSEASPDMSWFTWFLMNLASFWWVFTHFDIFLALFYIFACSKFQERVCFQNKQNLPPQRPQEKLLIPAGFRPDSGRIPAGFRPVSGRFPAGSWPDSGRNPAGNKSMISHYGNSQFYTNPFWAHPFKLTPWPVSWILGLYHRCA